MNQRKRENIHILSITKLEKEPDAPGDVSQFGALATAYLFGEKAILLLSKTIVEETQKYSGVHIDDMDDSPVPIIRNSEKGVLG